MDLGTAFREAVAAYWEGREPERTKKEMKGRFKYGKDFFDKEEEKAFGNITEADSWDGVKKK